MVYLAISIIIFLPYTLLLVFYRKAWISIRQENYNGGRHLNRPFISVIIPARNEERNIGHCLDSLLRQDYPSHLFEVIVIDDHSTDNTVSIVESIHEANPGIRLIRLSDYTKGAVINSYKKKAIAIGIEHAQGTLIATTDADCTVPEKWLETIGYCFLTQQPAMIAAPVCFDISSANHFLQKVFFIFQSLDFMTLQGITGAAIHKKLHYLANGANLAYTKKVFEMVNGFKGIDNIASGDDILLMEKIGFDQNIQYLKNKSAIVTTCPEPTIRTFLNQRIRWAGKSSAYSDKKIKLVLVLVYLVNVWLIAAAAGAIISKIPLLYFLILFFAKIFTDLFFLFPVGHFFGQRKLVWWLILLEPFHVIYIIIAGWLGAFGSYSWKGRKVK